MLPSIELTWKLIEAPTFPKAPCSCMVCTWATEGLPYHKFGIYVCTMALYGASALEDDSIIVVPSPLSCKRGGTLRQLV